jgi:O-methyltransferase
MDICRKKTMVAGKHLLFLQSIIEQINAESIPGDIVECGVWKGGCSMWMMICQKKHNMYRNFVLYDTFDGMTFPDSEKDAKGALSIYNQITAGKYERPYDKWHGEKKWAFAPIDLVQANIKLTEYDESKIRYVMGDVCTTLNTSVPSEISILRLDTDWYSSTKKELDVLFPLVVQHGYVIVDDYYAWKGSRTATDEFLETNKDQLTIIDPKLTGGIFVFRKNSI